MVATERAGARTIACERTLAELRRALAEAGRRATWEERQRVALSHLRGLRAAKNEAGRCERPGLTAHDLEAHDARYDVVAMRRYLDLLAACRRREHVAQGWGAVTGRPCSPAQAAYMVGR